MLDSSVRVTRRVRILRLPIPITLTPVNSLSVNQITVFEVLIGYSETDFTNKERAFLINALNRLDA